MEDYNAAYAAFDDAAIRYRDLGLHSDEADCLNRLANAYDAQKLYSQAVEAYGRAIELFPDEAMWYRNRVSTYIEMKDFEAAAADLARAATLQPDHPYLPLRRGDLAFEQGQYAEAAGHYRQFIAGLPSVNGGHFGLGCALLGLGQEEAGLDEIRQALALTTRRGRSGSSPRSWRSSAPGSPTCQGWRRRWRWFMRGGRQQMRRRQPLGAASQ